MKATSFASKELCLHRTARFILFSFFLLFFFQANAQSAGQFELEKGVQLMPDQTELSFTNQIPLTVELTKFIDLKYIDRLNTPITTAVVDKENQVLIIQIEKRAKPEWTVEDWNGYLESLHQAFVKHTKI